MKICGMVLIMLSSAVSAGQVSGYNRRRISYLRTLMSIINDITSRISYAPEDVFSVCSGYAAERFYPFCEVFGECAVSGDELIDTMKKGFSRIRELEDEAAEAVISAFEGIISSSLNGAVGQLSLCEKRLGNIYENILEDCRTKGKMYEKLCILGGVFICVLLA